LFAGNLVRRTVPSLILLLAISTITIFFRLGSLPLTGADEPRYARIAQEMHDRGDWVTPTLEAKPWLEKPPLYYWLTIPFYSAFQSPETAARVAPALCALISALAIFWLASAAVSRLAGLTSATILLTSLGLAGFGRSASTDMPFTCFFTLAMAVLAAAVRKDIGMKALTAYVFLGLAILAKGPVALILAAGIGLSFWLLHERGGVLRRWHVAAGIIVAAAVSIPWFWLAFRENGFAFISTFFINHNLARYVTDIHHHSQPFYYYLPVLLALVFPWSGWLAVLVSKSPLKALRRYREWDPLTVFLALWFLVPVVFFSLSDSKLAGYILPSLPPLALLLGIRVSRWLGSDAEPSGLRPAMWIQLSLSLAMAIAAPVFFNKDYGGRLDVGLILSKAILVPAIFAFVFGLRGKARHAFVATALQGVLLLFAVTQFAFPVLGAYHSTREIAHRALEVRQPGEPILTYRFFHHTLHYYTGYQAGAKIDAPESLRQLVKQRRAVLVVTKSADAQSLAGLEGVSVTALHAQGNFRLLRLAANPE